MTNVTKDSDDLFLQSLDLIPRVMSTMRKRFLRRDADDIRAVLLVQLWRCAKRYDPSSDASFSTYATHRLYGEVIDWIRIKYGYRRKRKQSNVTTLKYDVVDIRPSLSPFTPEEETDLPLKTLTRREREAVVWHGLYGLTLKETGERMGVGESRVCHLFREALERLRSVMQKP